MKMKYDYRDYELPLNDGMKGVEEAYENYLKDKGNRDLYDKLKEAVYYMSLDIKSARVCHQLPDAEFDEMSEYYWSLLL